MYKRQYQDTILDAADLPADDGDWPTMGSTATSYNLIHLLADENGEPIAYDDPIWEDLLDQLTYADLSRLCAVGLRMTASLESIGKPETLDHNGPEMCIRDRCLATPSPLTTLAPHPSPSPTTARPTTSA